MVSETIPRRLHFFLQPFQRIEKRFDEEGIKARKDAVLAFEVLMSFSPEMNGQFDIFTWGVTSMEWAEKRFGVENIMHAVLHQDETTPHLHLCVIPIVNHQGPRNLKHKKRLCFKQLFGGRTRSDMQKKLSELQDDYAMAMAPFGLIRGIKYSRRPHIPPAELRGITATLREDAQSYFSRIFRQISALEIKLQPDFLLELNAPGRTTIISSLQNELTCIKESLHGQISPLITAAETGWRGELVMLEDRRLDRSILAPGAIGNQLRLHVDHPAKYDAWNLDRAHRSLSQPAGAATRVEWGTRHSLVAEIVVHLKAGASSIRQRIRLRKDSRRVDFETEVDWHEEHRVLKVLFPVNVLSRKAAYEIQYGYIERPTHFNTSWDLAMFEACGHRWADLSESGLGVSLLSDSKYGYDIHGNEVQLTLLRSPAIPDPKADRGTHRFTYSILSHDGDFRAGRVIAEAAFLNHPVVILPVAAAGRGTLPQAYSFFQCDREAIVIDTIKRSEDGKAIIVRCYESHGSRGEARLKVALPVTGAQWCNLLEEPREAAMVDGSDVILRYRPFQIMTLRLEAGR